ncbi:hypothetical protein BaRGS_00001964 [Batillaria attramentaria]|uniref:Uncharacterized protein n=1 Tax=Batillaria attramentaria TaxID=370345 RepID=A0ABD0M5S9_9CAEN
MSVPMRMPGEDSWPVFLNVCLVCSVSVLRVLNVRVLDKLAKVNAGETVVLMSVLYVVFESHVSQTSAQKLMPGEPSSTIFLMRVL